MQTARLSDFRIVEVIKKRAKTSIVRELTSYSDETFTVKNDHLKPDEFVVLTEENAKGAKLIMQIAHPEYGVKSFHYKGQPLNDGDYCHTWGSGTGSACLFRTEMHLWRIIK